MKKIAIILTILMLGCAAVSAAPLTNYDFGHASFDIGLTLPSTVGQPNPNPGSAGLFGTTAGIQYGATVGLGAGLAIRVNHNEIYGPLGSAMNSGDVTMYYNSSQNNYDVMFGSPVATWPVFGSLYLGMQSYSPGVIGRDGSGNKEVAGAQAYGFHGGIQSVHQITDSTSAFYDVSYGTLDFDAKLGVAYSFTPNVDLNLSCEYNNLRLNQFGLSVASCNTVESWIPALTATLKF